MVSNCAGLAIERCGIAAPFGGAEAAVLAAAEAEKTAASSAESASSTSAVPAESSPFGIPFAIKPRTGDAAQFAKVAAAAASTMTGLAIGLDGLVAEATFRDNFLVADVGIGNLETQRFFLAANSGFLVLAGCNVKDNLMVCPVAGVALGDPTLQQSLGIYFLENVIDGNTMLAGLAAVFAGGLTRSWRFGPNQPE